MYQDRVIPSLTPDELAFEFGVSVATVRRWKREGMITPDMTTPAGKDMYSLEYVEELKRTSNRPAFLD